MTYQIFEWVIATYDEWTSDKSEHANRMYIAGTSEYIWYVTLIYYVFYTSNVTLK